MTAFHPLIYLNTYWTPVESEAQGYASKAAQYAVQVWGVK